MKDRLMITAMLKSALPKVNKLDLDDLTLKWVPLTLLAVWKYEQ
jgi:hypothetical protein